MGLFCLGPFWLPRCERGAHREGEAIFRPRHQALDAVLCRRHAYLADLPNLRNQAFQQDVLHLHVLAFALQQFAGCCPS